MNNPFSLQNINNFIKKDSFLFTCCLVAFVLPFSIDLTTKAILLMAIAWLLQGNFKNLGLVLRGNLTFWVFVSYYLLMVLALTYTEVLSSGIWELEKGACLIVFPILISSAPAISTSGINRIIKTFIVSNFLFGVISLSYATYVYFKEGRNIFFYHDLVTPLFESHATYYSMYVIFSLMGMFCLYKRDTHPSFLKNLLVGGVTLFFTVLIYLLSVRSITLLYSVAGMLAIVYYTLKTKNLKLGLSIFAGFLLLIFIAFSLNSTLQERMNQIIENHSYEMSEKNTEGYNGFTTRIAQWESSLSVIKKHLILGVAPADVQDELQEMYKKNYLVYCYKNKWNAHNLYLQTTLGLGLIGLAILLAGFTLPVFSAVRQRNFLYLGFLALFAFCSLTESTLSVQKGIAFYSFFQALFTFHSLQARPIQKENPS